MRAWTTHDIDGGFTRDWSIDYLYSVRILRSTYIQYYELEHVSSIQGGEDKEMVVGGHSDDPRPEQVERNCACQEYYTICPRRNLYPANRQAAAAMACDPGQSIVGVVLCLPSYYYVVQGRRLLTHPLQTSMSG